MVIFDLDGVLINSKNNMRKSWNKVREIHKIRNKFEEYFKYIGLPFLEILKRLRIMDKHSKIFKTFKKVSVKNFSLMKPYPQMKKVLAIIKNKDIKLSIVTSKEYVRTKKILNLYKIKNFNVVCAYSSKMRGKPHPDQLKYVLKKTQIKAQNTIYVGDMYVDFLASKNAKMKFVFAKYGYGRDNSKYKYKINSLSDLKYINKS